ncbi:MAG: threonine synthase [Bauldia sp.]
MASPRPAQNPRPAPLPAAPAYVSTRGGGSAVGFGEALIAGLAPDGGLFVPVAWPKLDRATIAGFAGRPYAAVAAELMQHFVGDAVPAAELQAICRDAYAAFRHPSVAPLVDIGPGAWLLELFHGPTLAFKDFAMQVLARLIDRALAASGRRATVIGATSGDTGGAAIDAFAGRQRTDVVILFPHGRVSDVQRRQMTTAAAANVHAVAIDGSFDDCQAIVKALFGRRDFAERVALTGVNSINWARIMAQTVYYFTAAAALGAPDRTVDFTVPTGNFGDVFAGYVAKQMGLPIGRLTIATNENDILERALASGRYEVRGVTATRSPSMDIQVSSNFERLLFEATGRDAGAVQRMMNNLAQSRGFPIPEPALARIRADFAAGRASEAETLATMKRLDAACGYLADPHSAVAVTVAGRQKRAGVPMVALATAHPAKFPDAVAEATGRRAALPPALADLMERPERVTRLANDAGAVAAFIEAKSRAAAGEAR